MIIDVNTYIGHWPFRQIRHNTAEGLLKYLDKGGVDRAVVSSSNAILYKDTQEGNIQLINEIKCCRDRFIPFAIINPAYTGWKKDFQYCIEYLDMKGLELYPYYHNYKLTDESALELITMAGDMKIPVHLPCAVENIRQKHWMDTDKNLSIDEVEKALALCPDVNFIITNGPTHNIAKRLKHTTSQRAGRVFYDFARVEVFGCQFESLLEAAGINNIVFGSTAPFQYIEPQMLKLYYSKLNDEEKEKVMHSNIEELFGL